MADPRFPERGDDISELVRNRQQRRPGPADDDSDDSGAAAAAVETGADTARPEAVQPEAVQSEAVQSEAVRAEARRADLVKADDVKADLVQTDPKDGADAAVERAGSAGSEPDPGARSDAYAAFGQPPVPAKPPVPAAARTAGADPLLQEGTAEALRRTWRRIQHDFVDNPNKAVAEADSLVQHTAAQVAAELEKLRTELRDSWNTEGRSGAADDRRRTTEELRLLLQEYRKLLNKLLDL